MDFDHEHERLSEADSAKIAQAIWEQETIELRTVGIDIGSSTSHLLFARVLLKRLSEGLSSRFIVTEREILWRSPIMLTPFLPDGTIDAHKLSHFVHDAYHDAGLHRSDIDSGAVILTGEAIKRKNARAIDEIFAAESGKFVCATAGHKLECILAAHGSGATALARRRGECGLHVDVGGGTTKLALIDGGEIVSVAAFAVGGRLLAQDAQGGWTRIDDSAQLVARELGIEATPANFADAAVRQKIAERLAAIAVDQIEGKALDALGRALELTEPLLRTPAPAFITFSGGVSEYIFARESRDHGDIAKLLAAEIVKQIKARIGKATPIIEPAERIRATVIGASQFTVQVSGKTIYVPDMSALPVHNIPVVHLGLDLSGDIDIERIVAAFRKNADILDLAPASRLALAFTWDGEPDHARLSAMANAIMRFAAPAGKRGEALFLMIDGDVGSSLGRILHKELRLDCKIVSIDGIKLRELDFVDVGELLDPPGVVPVVIKSLLFS
ncbi:reactivating factor for ethanolamine ammonia lyase [Oxalobacteraceae bacterium CAVE-383]|nr:reactivating factor for ethanolamine ammonia lyase [Oxalobacteraceae bacterium CAVE-383]